MLNKTILIGNLVAEPELKYTPNGTAVGKIRLAVTRTFNREETDFINVVVWRKTAENCANYLKKGSQVCVEGRMQVRSYEAQDGSKRWVAEVVAENVHFLGRKGQENGGSSVPPGGDDALAEWEKLGREVQPGEDYGGISPDEDEIPF